MYNMHIGEILRYRSPSSLPDARMSVVYECMSISRAYRGGQRRPGKNTPYSRHDRLPPSTHPRTHSRRARFDSLCQRMYLHVYAYRVYYGVIKKLNVLMEIIQNAAREKSVHAVFKAMSSSVFTLTIQWISTRPSSH